MQLQVLEYLGQAELLTVLRGSVCFNRTLTNSAGLCYKLSVINYVSTEPAFKGLCYQLYDKKPKQDR